MEQQRRILTQKYQEDRSKFEEEKRKKQLDIQQSIDRLNVSTAEKEALRRELDSLTHQQRTLQVKIDELERTLEGERVKKRTAERELGEVSITLN